MPSPTFHNYIDGQWVAGATFENRNPADTSDLVGEFVSGTATDMADAVDAASRALPAWSAMPGPARGALLHRVADGLDRKFEQLSEELTREEGKTLPESKSEVRRAINIFRYFAGEGSRMPGPVVPSERDRIHMWAQRKPIGVVGLITPWNFPIAIPAWKMAPALICGNTVVIKPALRAVSFTGSCGVGEWLHAEASKRRLRIQLEMGGKNPTIVLADAPFEQAVENTVNAAFFSTGQKCTATSRVIVEDSIYDRFLAALVERTKKLKVGNGLEPGIDIGPAVDQSQLDTNLKYIKIGRKEAGEPLCGGHRLTGGDYDKGYFISPTIFANVTAQMTIAQEEIFGPVLAVMRASDFEDAMRIANEIPFGLSSSIQTSNISRVFEFVQRAEAGLLTVNLPSAGVEYQLPFGGSKDSSFGPKEQGPAAMEFYSDWKTVYLKY